MGRVAEGEGVGASPPNRSSGRRGRIQGFFVYGTLMRGHLRQGEWPARPVRISEATIAGVLYDLGPFPGLRPGSMRVAGEFWQFRASDMPTVIARLDRIEGFSGRTDDLYRREVVECQLDDGQAVLGYTYFYAGASHPDRPLPPGADGRVRWTRDATQEG